MKISLRKKLFLSFSLILSVFTILILSFQYDREKEFKISQLETTLKNITSLTHNYIITNNLYLTGNIDSLSLMKSLIPGNDIRITVIDLKGNVLYDSEVENYSVMENHIYREEIVASKISGFGAKIRKSHTTGKSYYYYATSYPDYYIRTAKFYDIEIQNFLHVNNLFLFYILTLLLLAGLLIFVITGKISDSVHNLKDFIISLNNGDVLDKKINFPNDELGVISKQIINIYNNLIKTKSALEMEKNKLFSHLQVSNEGVAFFSADKTKILSNNHFIHYLNIISDKSTITTEKVFQINELEPIILFIENEISNKIPINEHKQKEILVSKENKYFNVSCIIYHDNTFEIIISDITKLEKQKLFKQQMTSNIAHDLKTPVATIMGYLETILNNDLAEKNRTNFLNKAFNQSKRLSTLIEDISTLNKIEEAESNFLFENFDLTEVIEDVYDNLYHRLIEKNISINIEMKKNIKINGVRSLLFSIFYNLFENVIKYGGENIDLYINNYLNDGTYLYFSFANTGNEIESSHLNRIFERFYRVDSGRNSKVGGTGLGLAIVKNAIELHGGTISVKQFEKSGVEFLFSIRI